MEPITSRNQLESKLDDCIEVATRGGVSLKDIIRALDAKATELEDSQEESEHGDEKAE